MKKVTFTMHAFLCMLLMMLAAAPAWADIPPTSAKDFFGKYKFKAKMELTEFGQQYADLLKDECDVTIAKDNGPVGWDMVISGMAGATDVWNVNAVSFEKNLINVPNPNGSAYLWGTLTMANADGNYPYAGDGFSNYQLSFDPNTLNMTMPDFTAVMCNHELQTAEVAARFTECTLTFIEGEEIVIEDISGEYHFTSTSTMPDSPLPKECEMLLTAENESGTAYTVTMDFAENGKFEFKGCSFDGVKLTMPFNETYMNDEVFVFSPYNTAETKFQGELSFNKSSTSSSLIFSSGMYLGIISEEGTIESSKGKIANYQWYMNGTAVKKGVAVEKDFNGTYTFKAADAYALKEDYKYVGAGEDFKIKVEKYEGDGIYYIYTFMGFDTYGMNYGGIPCTVDGNTLKITSSTANKSYYLNMMMDESGMNPVAYDLLADGLGEMSGEPIALTLNDDGTATLGDFFIMRWDFNTNVTEPAAYYGNITGKKDGSNISAVTGKKEAAVYVQDGTIYVKGGMEAALKVYNVDGREVFNGVASQVNGLPKGLYVVKCGESVSKVLL